MGNETEGAFTRDGVTMRYTRSGTATGRVFVLVHGIGMGHRVFRELADELDEAGLVYAVDLPGFGDSPEPARAMSIPESGDYLAAFVSTLRGDDVVLIGHSMGTQVVAEALAQHPEIARSAVLIAPTVNAAERTALRQGWRLAQDLINEDRRVLGLGLVQYAKAGPRWFIAKMHQMLDHRLEDVVTRVRARTLVLRGEDDLVCPHDWVAGIAASLPDGTMREVRGRGHEAMIRSPHPVAGMILEHVGARQSASADAE